MVCGDGDAGNFDESSWHGEKHGAGAISYLCRRLDRRVVEGSESVILPKSLAAQIDEAIDNDIRWGIEYAHSREVMKDLAQRESEQCELFEEEI